MIICGRGGQTDKVQTGLLCRNAQLFVFFRRQVDDDQTVDASLFRLHQKLVYATAVDRVVVAHQNNRGRVIFFTEGTCNSQRLVQRHVLVQRALTGQLNGRAVGHRIGKGQAQFDDVHASAGKRLNDFQRFRFVRIARHYVGYKSLTVLSLQRGEFCVDASHGRPFLCSASPTA